MSQDNLDENGPGVTDGQDDSDSPHRIIPWFIIFSAICGFVIIAAGFFATDVDPRLSYAQWPMISVGMAIVMGAVGAQVTTKLKWVSASGAAAMVLVFSHVFTPTTDSPFVYGHLRGTQESVAVVVKGQTRFLSGKTDSDGYWQFFALDNWLNGEIFSITMTLDTETGGPPVIIGCIDLQLLREAVGLPSGLDLTLARIASATEGEEWVLVKTSESEKLGHFGNPECPVNFPDLTVGDLGQSKDGGFGSDLAGLLIPQAAAQEAVDPRQLYYGLSSGNLEVQTDARDSIAGLREGEAIATIIENWSPEQSSQEVDTNLMVAWVSAIRQDRALAVPIATEMSPDQLAYIVALTGSTDRTARYNATELLSWMTQATGWPNPVPEDQSKLLFEAVLAPYQDPVAFARSFAGRDELDVGNVSYNALVALNWAACAMAEDDRAMVADVLAEFEAMDVVRNGDFARTVELARRFRDGNCE